MGGEAVEAGEKILSQAGIPTFPYPDTAAPCSPTCGGSPITCKACTKPPICRPTVSTATNARERAEAIIAAVRARPARADRARVQATAGRLRHSHGPHGSPRLPMPRSALPTRSATRSCSSSTPRPSPTRPTWAASSSTWAMPTPSRAFRASSLGHATGRRRALPGRDRPADGQARRLRTHHRQQRRPAIRAGAALRHGRPAGRGLQGPRSCPAPAQYHAGSAHDGANQDLHRAARAFAAAGR